MSSEDREWTNFDLDRLRQLDERNVPPAQIADRLQRRQADIEDRLTIVRARAPGPVGPDEEGDVPLPRDVPDDSAAWVHTDSATQRAASAVAGKRDDVEQANAAASSSFKIGDALEDDQPDIATRELRDADNRTQQATSPVGASQGLASIESDRALIRQAEINAREAHERMRAAGFGDHKGTKGF